MTAAAIKADLNSASLFIASARAKLDALFPIDPNIGTTWKQVNSSGSGWHDQDYSPTLKMIARVSSTGSGIEVSIDGGKTFQGTNAPVQEYKGVCWCGFDNAWWAVAKTATFVRSTDGYNWPSVSAPSDNQWHNIISIEAHGVMLAVAQFGSSEKIGRFTLASGWVGITCPDGLWQAAAYLPWVGPLGQVEVVGEDGKRMTSDDLGLTWVLRPMLPGTWKYVDAAPELGLAFAVTELDLVAWTDGTEFFYGTAPAGRYHMCKWFPEIQLGVAVGQEPGAKVITTIDGKEWTAKTVPTEIWQGVTLDIERMRLSVVGLGGTALYSPDDTEEPPPPPPPGDGKIDISGFTQFGFSVINPTMLVDGVEAKTYPNCCRVGNGDLFWRGVTFPTPVPFNKARIVAPAGRKFKENAGAQVTVQLRGSNDTAAPTSQSAGELIVELTGANVAGGAIEATFTAIQFKHVWWTGVAPDSGTTQMAQAALYNV